MKKNKGYSLVEVLVAFSILTVAMIPILSMYPMMFKMNRKAGTNEEYARLSLTIIDYIKSRGYNNLLSYDGTNAENDSFNIFNSSGITYTLTESENGGGFSSTDFESNFSIPAGFFILNSKEESLKGVKIKIMIKKDYFTLKGFNSSTNSAITYHNPVSGTNSTKFDLSIITTTDSVVGNVFIVGTITMGFDSDNDYSTTFVISPIENW